MTSKLPPLFQASDAKPSASAQNKSASASTTPPVTAPSAPAPALTGESLLQRLRYFENLVEQKDNYIAQLQAVIRRQGGAVPTAYFASFSGASGNYTPKGG